MRHPGLARNPPGTQTQQQDTTQNKGTDQAGRHSTERDRACLPLPGNLARRVFSSIGQFWFVVSVFAVVGFCSSGCASKENIHGCLEKMMKNAIRLIGTYYVIKWANDWLKKFKSKPREGLPLLLSVSQAFLLDETQGPRNLLKVFGNISEELLEQMHYVNKHLIFWQIRAQGPEQDKVRFMMLERGPVAFLRGLRKIVRSFFLESSLTSGLVSAAYTRINGRVTMLNTLRKRLAVIIGQVHLQVAKMGEKVDAGRESGVSGESRRVVSECYCCALCV